MLSKTAPVPIAAVFDAGKTAVQVTFDQPLATDPALDTANWTMRIDGDAYSTSLAGALGPVVSLAITAGAPDPGIDQVTFAPPPNDVLATSSGLAAAAFADYPLAPA